MSEACRIVVPSDSWPTLAAAVADAEAGTQIHIQQGHSEVLRSPLIIDKAVHIEGPEGGHCSIESEESIIVAPGKNAVVVLKRLELKVFGAPALILAGGCHLEHCSIDGASTGVEVAAHAGSSVRIQGSIVQNCKIGVSLSGGADCVMDGSQIQQCVVGCSVTGMVITEGWNEKLGSVAKAKFKDNVDADLTLRGWSIQEKGGEGVRFSAPDGEVVVKGWPSEACNVVAPTESGAAVLLFNGGQVNATLFEESEEEEESNGGSDGDSPMADSPSTAARTARSAAEAEGAEVCGDEPSAGADAAPDAALDKPKPRKTKRGSFLMEEIPSRASLAQPEADGPAGEADLQQKAGEESGMTEPAEQAKAEPAEKATEEPGPTEPAEHAEAEPKQVAEEAPGPTEPAEQAKAEPAEKATEEPGPTEPAEQAEAEPKQVAEEEPGPTEPAEQAKAEPAEKATEEPGPTEPAEQAEAEPKQVAVEEPGPTEPAEQAEAEPKLQPEQGPAPAEPVERQSSPKDDAEAAPAPPRALV